MKQKVAIICLATACWFAGGCTRLRIETPSGYKIRRDTTLVNRNESLVLYDPDTGKPLGEYRRVDEEKGTEAMAILAQTISDLVTKLEAAGAAAP